MKKNKFLILIILTATMSLTSLQAFSFQAEQLNPPQPPAGSPSKSGGAGLPPPPGLPIDGFLGYFLVAGAIFGVRKLRKKD